MKRAYYLIVSLVMLCLFANAETTRPTQEQDTITIKIGKSQKIIIFTADKKALAELQIYDINKIIRDLNKSLDTLDTNDRTVIITDENGKRYKIDVYDEDELADADKDIDIDVDIDIEEDEDGEDGEKKDKDSKFNVHFNKESKSIQPFHTKHFFQADLGINNYLEDGDAPNDKQYAVKPWGSWYVGLNSKFRTHLAGPLAIEYGGGISWYNFKFEDASTRISDATGQVEFIKHGSTELDFEKSKLTATYLNLSFVPVLDFGYKKEKVKNDEGSVIKTKRTYSSESFRIGLGGYAGYRIASYAKYKFEETGETEKKKDRDSFLMSNWRYGVRLQIGIKGVDLFANYDLNELFQNGKGPELNAISFGITI